MLHIWLEYFQTNFHTPKLISLPCKSGLKNTRASATSLYVCPSRNVIPKKKKKERKKLANCCDYLLKGQSADKLLPYTKTGCKITVEPK